MAAAKVSNRNIKERIKEMKKAFEQIKVGDVFELRGYMLMVTGIERDLVRSVEAVLDENGDLVPDPDDIEGYLTRREMRDARFC